MTVKDASKELVVVRPNRDWKCARCGTEKGEGQCLTMTDNGPICMTCSGLINLALVPTGNARLTRRAKALREPFAVVVKWSRARKRHERQGILVDEAALVQAESECLTPEEARFRYELRHLDDDAPASPRALLE